MMFGSDWPVANVAGDYDKVWSETGKAISEYTLEERDAILGSTAADFYRIEQTVL
jgi:L-fuconolactonase